MTHFLRQAGVRPGAGTGQAVAGIAVAMPPAERARDALAAPTTASICARPGSGGMNWVAPDDGDGPDHARGMVEHGGRERIDAVDDLARGRRPAAPAHLGDLLHENRSPAGPRSRPGACSIAAPEEKASQTLPCALASSASRVPGRVPNSITVWPWMRSSTTSAVLHHAADGRRLLRFVAQRDQLVAGRAHDVEAAARRLAEHDQLDARPRSCRWPGPGERSPAAPASADDDRPWPSRRRIPWRWRRATRCGCDAQDARVFAARARASRCRPWRAARLACASARRRCRAKPQRRCPGVSSHFKY